METSKTTTFSSQNPKKGLHSTLPARERDLFLSQKQMEERTEFSSTTFSGIACDQAGTITSYGVGAQRIFGWTPEEVIGKEKVVIFHEPEAIPTLVPRLLKTAADKGKFEEEVTLVRKNGTKFRAILTVRPLKKGNNITGYVGITKPIRDI
jgi:PAS domain S-box-containing protein